MLSVSRFPCLTAVAPYVHQRLSAIAVDLTTSEVTHEVGSACDRCDLLFILLDDHSANSGNVLNQGIV